MLVSLNTFKHSCIKQVFQPEEFLGNIFIFLDRGVRVINNNRSLSFTNRFKLIMIQTSQTGSSIISFRFCPLLSHESEIEFFQLFMSLFQFFESYLPLKEFIV